MIRVDDTTALFHIRGEWKTLHTTRLLHERPDLADLPAVGPTLHEITRESA